MQSISDNGLRSVEDALTKNIQEIIFDIFPPCPEHGCSKTIAAIRAALVMNASVAGINLENISGLISRCNHEDAQDSLETLMKRMCDLGDERAFHCYLDRKLTCLGLHTDEVRFQLRKIGFCPRSDLQFQVSTVCMECLCRLLFHGFSFQDCAHAHHCLGTIAPACCQ
jgi:hypothetical protein